MTASDRSEHTQATTDSSAVVNFSPRWSTAQAMRAKLALALISREVGAALSLGPALGKFETCMRVRARASWHRGRAFPLEPSGRNLGQSYGIRYPCDLRIPKGAPDRFIDAAPSMRSAETL